jgi:hypothetical protein
LVLACLHMAVVELDGTVTSDVPALTPVDDHGSPRLVASVMRPNSEGDSFRDTTLLGTHPEMQHETACDVLRRGRSVADGDVAVDGELLRPPRIHDIVDPRLARI